MSVCPDCTHLMAHHAGEWDAWQGCILCDCRRSRPTTRLDRIHYRATYVTSSACGYLLAGVLYTFGARWAAPVSSTIRATAAEHARQAARREGPYLAWVTFLASLALLIVTGAILVRAARS